MAKWNEGVRIEAEMAKGAVYAGRSALTFIH
jgi:hypothetical protein